MRTGSAGVHAVGRKQQIELRSLGANVTDRKDDVADDLVLEAEVPSLRVGPAEITVGRVGVMNRVGRKGREPISRASALAAGLVVSVEACAKGGWSTMLVTMRE